VAHPLFARLDRQLELVLRKYALEPRTRDVVKNLRLVKRLAAAFERDYRKFAAAMLAA
jgi:hypothetical protein